MSEAPLSVLPTTANQAWFWCKTHACAHRGTFHNGETTEACTDVGPFLTQHEAEAFKKEG